MPNTDNRRVDETYWYRSTQIEAIGSDWQTTPPQDEEAQRHFIYFDHEEVGNKTALTAVNLPPWDGNPQKIMLPFNKGNSHWTAITIHIKSKQDILLSYTDSSNRNGHLKNHNQVTRDEITRIENILREAYPKQQDVPENITAQFYPHTWAQMDGSSCGPYSLENAFRCLAGIGGEDNPGRPNPGRRVLRDEQLNQMPAGSVAVRGASDNIKVDEVLTDWVHSKFLSQQDRAITDQATVTAMITAYALKNREAEASILEAFNDGYNPTNNRGSTYWLGGINNRIKALFCQKEPALLLEQQGIKRNKRNIAHTIDNLRQALFNAMDDEVAACRLAHEIIGSIHGNQQQEAIQKLPENFSETDVDKCKTQINKICKTLKKYNKTHAHDEKVIYLAKAYQDLAVAKEQIQLDTIKLSSFEKELKAHVTLLKGAISRDSASLIRQVCFAITDFCSRLLDFLSAGYWESNIKRINTIREKLSDDTGNVSTKQLNDEKEAIQTLLTCKTEHRKALDRTNDVILPRSVESKNTPPTVILA
jgi:hypothetical protein